MLSFLFFPSGNSFSHLEECLAIGRKLEALGHQICFGISRYYEQWAQRHLLRYTIIAELWEQGPTDHPNMSWFLDRDYLSSCVQEEIECIQGQCPDYIIANFKYTTGISARITDTKLICINILSMLPLTRANFGYLANDRCPLAKQQHQYLHFFDQFCTAALNQVSREYGGRQYACMADFLEGDLTIFPDSPWFQDQSKTKLTDHYFPANLTQCRRTIPNAQIQELWSKIDQKNTPDLLTPHGARLRPCQSATATQARIFMALGSTCRADHILLHLALALQSISWQTTISLSGYNKPLMERIQKQCPNITVVPYAQFDDLMAEGLDLYICHGGLGSIYSALHHCVPLLVVPLQPEQDHNGMLVEHHGIGRRLFHSQPFTGNENQYKKRILSLSTESITATVTDLITNAQYKVTMKQAHTTFLQEISAFPHPAQIIQRLCTGHRETDVVPTCEMAP